MLLANRFLFIMAQRIIISTVNCDNTISDLFIDFAKEKGFNMLKKHNETDEDNDCVTMVYMSKEL